MVDDLLDFDYLKELADHIIYAEDKRLTMIFSVYTAVLNRGMDTIIKMLENYITYLKIQKIMGKAHLIDLLRLDTLEDMLKLLSWPDRQPT